MIKFQSRNGYASMMRAWEHTIEGEVDWSGHEDLMKGMP
jgi:hypothetical protein